MTTVPQTALESTYPYYGLKTVAPSQFHPSLMTRLRDRTRVKRWRSSDECRVSSFNPTDNIGRSHIGCMGIVQRRRTLNLSGSSVHCSF
ncbi:MAG: hypothetical protein RH949_09550 [Coleofasciculus sp. A1-SPW-01]|uniref:hypothetical protein n=1 Tax=Coleofasciculus sp. A1-SPW-01 TaxID=3070819 RepID=UPI0032F8A17B